MQEVGSREEATESNGLPNLVIYHGLTPLGAPPWSTLAPSVRVGVPGGGGVLDKAKRKEGRGEGLGAHPGWVTRVSGPGWQCGEGCAHTTRQTSSSGLDAVTAARMQLGPCLAGSVLREERQRKESPEETLVPPDEEPLELLGMESPKSEAQTSGMRACP